MFIAALLTSSLLLSASTSTGADANEPQAGDPPAATAETKAGKAKKDPLVCREEVKANSRFTTRVCARRSAWEQRANEREETWRKDFNGPVVKVGGGGGQ